MRRLCAALVVSTAVFAFPAQADDTSAVELLRTTVAHMRKVRTVHASIEQTLKQLGRTKKYSGSYIAGDGKFRVELDKPRSQTIVSNGESLRWFVPSLKTVWEAKAQGARGASMSFRPGGMLDDAMKGYSYTAYREPKMFGLLGENVRFEIVPDEQRADISKVDVVIDRKKQVILHLDLYDATGELSARQHFSRHQDFGKDGKFPGVVEVNMWTPVGIVTSTTKYEKIRVNQTIADDAFALSMPDGTQTKELGGSFAP